jgi:hypothetical protein
LHLGLQTWSKLAEIAVATLLPFFANRANTCEQTI